MPDRNTPVPETPYNDEELEHFKNLLIQEQKETTEEIEQLRQSVEDVTSKEDDEKSSVDHHPGNLGAEEQIKERDYLLIERDMKKLKNINAALDRISNGSYGICEHTGQTIEKERLEAVPYTRYSLEAQKKRDDPNPGSL